MGELLSQMEKAKPPGDNQYKKVDRSHESSEAKTLSELGITKNQSSLVTLILAQLTCNLPQLTPSYRLLYGNIGIPFTLAGTGNVKTKQNVVYYPASTLADSL